MQRESYNYELPQELVATEPLSDRADSRLMCVNKSSGVYQHKKFRDISKELRAGDLLIINESKVMRARLFGFKVTGGKVEILVERVLTLTLFKAQVFANKKILPDSILTISEDVKLKVISEEPGGMYQLELQGADSIYQVMADYGEIPLPPYMRRAADSNDTTAFQTVYAKVPGSVASPSAGRHFDDALLQRLQAQGVQIAKVVLHIGAGTFLPVKVTDISKHVMHSEYCELKQEVCDAIIATKNRGGRIVAVGTTVVRTLETAALKAENKLIAPFSGDTKLFIYPGFNYKIVDALITNFHLPHSTLLMLVSAFVGRERLLALYMEAVKQQYRFYTYGDAMFIY